MITRAVCLFFFCCAVCLAEQKNLNLSSSESKITFNIDSEYQLKLYEPLHKRWSAFVSGKIQPDYDLFGNELKTNVFTTLGIDF